MDVTTVNNAVSDALAGLPAGTSSFINANIGTAAGQQAIYNAGVSLGLSQSQIAAAVSQATGQTVTPQQVAQVAATVAPPAPPPAAPVAPAYTPPPATAPAQTTLGNMASPQFVGTTAPGAVGTNYGQASNAQIASVQQSSPDFATALQNGTAKMTYDGEGVPYLYDAKTGQPIAGNYQLQVGNNGALGINVPAVDGSMIQIATNINQDGSLPPVTASNVLNVGLNAGAGGFAGGISAIKPLLTQAALMYAGSQLGALGGGESALDAGMGVYPTGGVDPTLLGNASALDAGMNNYPTTGQIGTQSALDAGSGVYPLTNVNPAINPSNATTLGNVGTPVTTPAAPTTTPSTVPTTTTPVTTPTGTPITAVAPVSSALDAGANVYPSTGNIGVVPPVSTLLTPTNVLAGSAALNALGTLGTNKAIANAAGTQAQAGQNVQNVLGGFYDQYAGAQQPYQNIGSGAVQEIQNQAPYLTHQFNAADLTSGLAPNYDFMLAQGAGANRNAANVGGGLLSGNTLQGLNTYNQNYAQNAYQNAFNNYQTQRQNIYGNLAGVAGMGQTSLGQLGQVGSNLAQTYGNVTTGLAATQAGAQTAQAVNTQNTLSNLGNTALVASLIKPA